MPPRFIWSGNANGWRRKKAHSLQSGRGDRSRKPHGALLQRFRATANMECQPTTIAGEHGAMVPRTSQSRTSSLCRFSQPNPIREASSMYRVWSSAIDKWRESEPSQWSCQGSSHINVHGCKVFLWPYGTPQEGSRSMSWTPKPEHLGRILRRGIRSTTSWRAIERRSFSAFSALLLSSDAQPLWKHRWSDVKKVLQERKESVLDRVTDDFLAQQDREVQEIYLAAIQRIHRSVEDKDHYGREAQAPAEDGKEKRAKARMRKKDLLEQLKDSRPPQGHQWQAHKRGYKCGLCSKEVNSQTPYAQLVEVKDEKCPQHGMEVRGGKQETRDEFLQKLLADTSTPQAGKHQWGVNGHYLRCTCCGCSHLKRSRM